MSPFTHANTFEVQLALQRLSERIGEPEEFGLVYENNVKLIETVMPLLQFVTYAFLRYVREVLVGAAEVPNPSQLASTDEALRWARFVLVSLPKDYWQQVVDDIDYLFQVLEIVDRGGDWQALRDTRPVVPHSRQTS